MSLKIHKELIRVNIDCNANCLFCNFCRENEKNFKNPTFAQLAEKIDRMVKNGVTDLVISGGEPLLRPDLLELIYYAKNKRIKRLELQTNAFLLTPEKIESFKKAGLNKFFISFHTHSRFINQKLFGRNYPQGEIIRNIIYLNKKCFKVTLNPVITSLNFQGLPTFARFIVKNFPWLENISLSVVQPHGKALRNRFIFPDYSIISKYIKSFRKYIADNSQIYIMNPYCGLPICIGGWIDKLSNNAEYAEGSGSARKNTDKIHLPVCSQCQLSNYCNGVWKEYPEIFTTDTVNSWLTPVKE